uniref:Phosphatidylethanolamine N-methyltransferase n=1 Tax=Branchiostoma floridae TaxID=7739 RepID=C3Z402_BRAFL|eukprot:XP_002596603.1 hypothetical protein BRAFLDRAFT_114470 [Branchiostoma floridae]
MSFITDYLRLNDPNFLITVVLIMFSPTYWNLVARSEYRSHWVTHLFRSARVGCSVLAVSIMLLGLHRDWWFKQTLYSQPKVSAIQSPVLGYAVIAIGALLVLSSFWALGWYGTFLGDYFGMLMDEPVTSFPFNLVSDPMYVGTTMNFAGVALLEGSLAGLVLAALVGLCYKVALLFEGPFTEEIYRKRDADKRKVY